MTKINCPFCDEKIISDVANNKKEVEGIWQCNNGHMFKLKFMHDVSEE